MLLAIDIGNTTVSLGVFQGERLCATWKLATDARKTPDEYALILTSLLPLKDVQVAQISAIAMCSVVPPLTPTFQELSHSIFKVDPLVVGTGVKTGIRILYDNPHDVGADRIVDATAAFRIYGGPAIVVDFGTATVFDAISADGDYLGGAISPGLQVAAESLFKTTSQLRRVELTRPRAAIGKNTVHSMQSGLIFGYVGLVEGMVRHFLNELGPESHVIATGGYANLISKETSLLTVVDQNLTLHGLRFIYDMNRGVSASQGD
jgi:type III pantothenate kinase